MCGTSEREELGLAPVDDDDSPDHVTWTAMLAIMLSLCGVFVVVALIACALCTHQRIKDNKQPLRHLERVS